MGVKANLIAFTRLQAQRYDEAVAEARLRAAAGDYQGAHAELDRASDYLDSWSKLIVEAYQHGLHAFALQTVWFFLKCALMPLARPDLLLARWLAWAVGALWTPSQWPRWLLWLNLYRRFEAFEVADIYGGLLRWIERYTCDCHNCRGHCSMLNR